jgi:predicted nucleic acid-binding protein
MAAVLLDTNVLLRHFLQDHEDHSPKATAFLSRVERGEVQAFLPDTVLFETVFNMQRRHGVTRAVIRESLSALVELPSLDVPARSLFPRALDLYVEANISFADAYHVALMERLGIGEVASFDRDFDRVAGIRRVEPR